MSIQMSLYKYIYSQMFFMQKTAFSRKVVFCNQMCSKVAYVILKLCHIY